jgi:hypothetical protein
VDSHVLALAALRAEYPDQRRALLELRTREVELKQTARRLLEQVWKIAIGQAEPQFGEPPRIVAAS